MNSSCRRKLQELYRAIAAIPAVSPSFNARCGEGARAVPVIRHAADRSAGTRRHASVIPRDFGAIELDAAAGTAGREIAK